MPDPITAAIAGGTSLIGGIMGNKAAKSAANTAAEAQTQASQASIEEARRQFDAIQAMLAPYTQAGTGSLSAQQALLGLSGQSAQQQAISGIESSPWMQSMTQQGENALLQNASATGGLRSGNLQAALAQFRPQLLNQAIQNQLTNLGGITSIGQNAAANTGNAGMQTSTNVINSLNQIGAANAGAALAKGQASANMWGGLGSMGSTIGTLGMMGKLPGLTALAGG